MTTPRVAPVRIGRRLAGLVVPAVLLAAACTAAPPASGLPPIGAAPVTPPPAPPAACLLDTDALGAATGLVWTADATTASDTRCVYDPGPGAGPSGAAPTPPAATGGAGTAGGGEFVAVDVAGASAAAPAAQLDVLARACAKGSRTPTARTGFVCRFPAGSVFAARVRDGRVVTATASGVPTGTTVAALGTALGQQLDSLG